MIDGRQVQNAKKELGRKLATWRHRRGLRQHDLADEIPISRSSVAGAEAGNQAVDETFWARCDTLLRANGELVTAYRNYRELELRHQADRAEAARRERWGPSLDLAPLASANVSV
jgi:transcriptional regulator with XRE-family HTH domain